MANRTENWSKKYFPQKRPVLRSLSICKGNYHSCDQYKLFERILKGHSQFLMFFTTFFQIFAKSISLGDACFPSRVSYKVDHKLLDLT